MSRLYALIFSLLGLSTIAQTTIYNADFTNYAGDSAVTTTTGGWTLANQAAFGGGNYVSVLQDAAGLYPANLAISFDTPVIDLTGYDRLTFSFDSNYATEAEWDGATVEYSLDGGTTYATLGRFNDNAVNWYNDTDVDAIIDDTDGWSGLSGGWINSSIDLPSQAFDNANQVRFRFIFGSDNIIHLAGWAIDNIKVVGYPIDNVPYLDCGLGIGINLELWLNTRTLGGFSDNDKISRWPNITGRDPDWTDAIQPDVAKQPVYHDDIPNNVNFNPVVSFDGNESMFGRQGFYNQDIYIVIRPDTPIFHTTATEDIFMGDHYTEGANFEDVTGISINDTSARYGPLPDICAYNQGAQGEYGRAIISNTISYDRPVIFNARLNADGDGMDLFLDGVDLGATLSPALMDEVNQGTFNNILNSRYWIGRSEAFPESFKGDIVEIMCFSERKPQADKQRIESYLGLKYGITLGLYPVAAIGLPHVPGAYYNSRNTPLWNAAMHPGFTYNVAGIGRDDCTILNQKQAKSVDPNSFITVGLGDIYDTNSQNPNGFADDNDFLMWGSTPSTLTTMPTPISVDLGPNLVTTFTSVTERTWKFVEYATNDIPTVKLSVDTSGLSALPALTGNDAYVMILADDENFTSNVETVFLRTEGINQVANYDFDGTRFVKFGVAHEAIEPLHMEFDGSDDYVLFDQELAFGGALTASAWVQLDGQNDNDDLRTIISQRDGGSNGMHFYLRTDGRVVMQYGAGGTRQLVSATAVAPGEWRYVAFTHDGTRGRMYIDGLLDIEKNMQAPTIGGNRLSLGARYVDKNDVRDRMDGHLDEVRIFDQALSVEQLRFIMNQEIAANGNFVSGTVLPTWIARNDVSTLPWNSLRAYFNMNSYLGTHLNDVSGNAIRGSLVVPDNFTLEEQDAPLPYESTQDGSWYNESSWKNGAENGIPWDQRVVGGANQRIEWNIARTNHNLINYGSRTVLGLLSESNTISQRNNSRLFISHYFRLDGVVDLEGRSQLQQPNQGQMDGASVGRLERDQQGQSSKFNYNYWSSPVGTQGVAGNNVGYTVSDVLRDGTNPNNPQAINWIGGYDGSATTPISLASYWLHAFNNQGNQYANWQSLSPTTPVTSGYAFTMKGSDAPSADQNYTFTGKPNNGYIATTIAADNASLIGNPYPSSLDSRDFIQANLGSTDGSIYFWEHYDTNATHVLQSYEGGYATRNLTGGVAPVAPALVSGNGSSTKVPSRHIPVGQGFFINGSATGGTVFFNNYMRSFVREDNANSFTTFSLGKGALATEDMTNDETVDAPDTHMTLRLLVTTPGDIQRDLLIGFMGNNVAGPGLDPGYDAKVYDSVPDDAFFPLGGEELIIQGVGDFSTAVRYPLSVRTASAGIVEFDMTEVLRQDASYSTAYIYDNDTATYHDLSAGPVLLQMDAGTSMGRFELTFTDDATLGATEDVIEDYVVLFNTNQSQIEVHQLYAADTIDFKLFNMLGQQVGAWNRESNATLNFAVNLAPGTYLFTVSAQGQKQTHKLLVE